MSGENHDLAWVVWRVCTCRGRDREVCFSVAIEIACDRGPEKLAAGSREVVAESRLKRAVSNALENGHVVGEEIKGRYVREAIAVIVCSQRGSATWGHGRRDERAIAPAKKNRLSFVGWCRKRVAAEEQEISQPQNNVRPAVPIEVAQDDAGISRVREIIAAVRESALAISQEHRDTISHEIEPAVAVDIPHRERSAGRYCKPHWSCKCSVSQTKGNGELRKAVAIIYNEGQIDFSILVQVRGHD